MGFAESIIEAGAVDIMLKHLDLPPPAEGCERHMEFEVESRRKVESHFLLNCLGMHILRFNAQPTLIFMLTLEDAPFHSRAVGIIETLAFSSPTRRQEALEKGAFKPVIGLLSLSLKKTRIEAASLIALFAEFDSDCRVRSIQRGAVRPLVEMLKCEESEQVPINEMDILENETASFTVSIV